MGRSGHIGTVLLSLESDALSTLTSRGACCFLVSGSQLYHCPDTWDDSVIYLVAVIFATVLYVGSSAEHLVHRRRSLDVTTSFLRPLLALLGSTDPGQGQTLGAQGSCWWAPGWRGRLRGPASPAPPCARPTGPVLPPPPSFPLRPLRMLVRALTCEIKRDFNYLSAKQQLERITAQQRSPPAWPLPSLPSPLFLQQPSLPSPCPSSQAE